MARVLSSSWWGLLFVGLDLHEIFTWHLHQYSSLQCIRCICTGSKIHKHIIETKLFYQWYCLLKEISLSKVKIVLGLTWICKIVSLLRGTTYVLFPNYSNSVTDFKCSAHMWNLYFLNAIWKNHYLKSTPNIIYLIWDDLIRVPNTSILVSSGTFSQQASFLLQLLWQQDPGNCPSFHRLGLFFAASWVPCCPCCVCDLCGL